MRGLHHTSQSQMAVATEQFIVSFKNRDNKEISNMSKMNLFFWFLDYFHVLALSVGSLSVSLSYTRYFSFN